MKRGLPGLLLLAGCNVLGGDDPSGSGQTGDLGNGEFRYACSGDCAGPADAFPDAIAVGGQFGLTFAIGAEEYPVNSASPALLTETGGTFAGQRAGTVAVLARSRARIVDILHLDFQDVTSVGFEVDGEAADDNVVVTLGMSAEVAALPSGTVVLGGALPYTWSVDDTDVVELDGSGQTVTVTPLGAGSTVLRTEVAGVESSLTIFVGGEEPPRRITATSGYDPDTDGSDTDGDTDTPGTSTGGTSE